MFPVFVKIYISLEMILFGGADAPTLTGLSKEFLPRSVHCTLNDMRVIGDECFLTYRIKHQRKMLLRPRRKP